MCKIKPCFCKNTTVRFVKDVFGSLPVSLLNRKARIVSRDSNLDKEGQKAYNVLFKHRKTTQVMYDSEFEVGNGQTKSNQRKRRKCNLFFRQNGLCFYCEKPMILCFSEEFNKANRGQRTATFEHLDTKMDPNRGTFSEQERTVLACRHCNNFRGNFSVEDYIKLMRKS